MEEILQIIDQFQIKGTPEWANIFGSGHINESYKVKTIEESQPDYLLQKINHEVFKDVQGLMENISRVTEHIKSKTTSGQQQVLTIIPTKDGHLFYKDGIHCWRVFEFIRNAQTYEKAETEKQAFEAGKILGSFLRDLSDFPADELIITIPNFHNIEFRLRQFNKALSEAENNFKEIAQKQVEKVQQYSSTASKLYQSARSDLPLRVTHNDTKFNNVLFDERDHGYALVDLDTVMPGYIFYDIGDGIRTGVVSAEEDEQNLDLVTIDRRKYEAYIKGFLENAGEILNQQELLSIASAGFYMAFIMGVRFLTDYLNGNIYYKVDYPEHNYYRARCQLHLAALLNEKERGIEKLILDYMR